ncbi:MAG: hypothetical protein KDA63_17505, partial [Planctomycetales bacterium]|nr:hypothetical protein [Planctomycetales bacterium]
AYEHQNRSRLGQAKETADWVISQLPADSRVAVLDGTLASLVYQVDVVAASQRIDRLETTNVAQPLLRVAAEGLRLLAESPLEQKELYIFTDLTQQAWSSETAGEFQRRLSDASGVSVYLVDVGIEKPHNVALGEVKLSADVVSKNSALRLQSSLASDRGGQQTVELFIEDDAGRPEKRGETIVTLEPGTAVSFEMALSGLGEGTHQGYLKLVGRDGLVHDDIRYFTFSVDGAWPVLLVAPKPAAERAWHVTEALAPIAFRKTGRARFECSVIDYHQLGATTLEKYAAVCLIDPEPLPARAWRRLDEFVAGGGGLATLLGPRADPINDFDSPSAERLLPGRLLQQARRPDGDLFLDPRGIDHPLLANFAGLGGDVPWDLSPVYRYWQFDTLDADSVVVMRYTDQQPALIEQAVGGGRVLTLSTPLDYPSSGDGWNELLTSLDCWPALMLTNEMMLYLVGRSDVQTNYLTGDVAAVTLPRDSAVENLVLRSPGGDSSRRTVEPAQGVITVSQTERAGNYQLRAGGDEAGLHEGFSVNLPIGASDLSRAAATALDDVFGDFPYSIAMGASEIERDVNRGRVGRELFVPLMLIVALVLGGEHLLANRFYRNDIRAEADGTPAAAALAGATNTDGGTTASHDNDAPGQ